MARGTDFGARCTVGGGRSVLAAAPGVPVGDRAARASVAIV